MPQLDNTILVKSNDPDASTLSHWIGNMSELSALEELLYIWWEMSPSSREWKRDLAAYGRTVFDYYGANQAVAIKTGFHQYKVTFADFINKVRQ